ncbi:cardioacceleratory peptide receptor-like isoform X2 [Limulus polyphemus]|uniref:Cardioacceleratory peptide receptor-like isoform X1 n=1 Tax=Limulus polyphemus TaxID=6850 RepID=A0ABM1RWF6_LIMPO|nr:cardioacceleratory peptide receptor-like isoform X1 [Limulus polyphemus]XP_022235711.1 cardioacceleratory peptide receptor-like isoform X2 [Limulus polyphemus]
MVRYFQVLVMYSSTYVLVALSIDRYDAITRPLRFSGSWKRAKILIGSAWGLSALAASPAVFLNKESVIKGRLQCWIDMENWQWRLYMPLVAVSVFFFPAVVISGCYTVIVYTIWTKSKSLSYPKSRGSTFILKDKPGRFIDDEEADSRRRRASSRGIIPRAKIKTVKMTFVIVFVFILCWSPYFIYDLLQVFGYFPLNQTNIAVSTFIQSLAPLNSAANPFIYYIFSTHLCRTLSNFSCCQWFSRHSRACCSKAKRPVESESRTSHYTTVSEMFLRSSRLSTTCQEVPLETQPSVSDATTQFSKKVNNEKKREAPSETLEASSEKMHL